MKNKELKQKYAKMTKAEILKEIDGGQARLSDLISESVTGKLKNTSEIKTTRKNIARLHTLLVASASTDEARSRLQGVLESRPEGGKGKNE